METKERATTPVSKPPPTTHRLFNKPLVVLFPLFIAFISYFMSKYDPELVSDISGRTHETLGTLRGLLHLPSEVQRFFSDKATSKTPDNLAVACLEEGATHGNFRLLKRIRLNYTDATITKWVSNKTGLKVVHVDYQGPIINGYFAVATEIFDDSGCPHTLEHLVFHGSASYPYSDALQRIAARSFASTPNAYTAQDRTVYTISTAGEDSFLRLLPVFVDHILYPRLTNDTFVTEVYHVNGEGKDSGVVYSEMQGRENSPGDLVDLAYRRKLYPQGSGYRSETGGLMEALRTLSLEKIKAYHKSYYASHNLCLVVTGHLSTAALLDQIEKTVEKNIIQRSGYLLSNEDVSKERAGSIDSGYHPPEGWKRPFLETESSRLPVLDKDQELIVEFPAKEERYGDVTLIMLGPKPDEEILHAALSLLGDYLAGNIVAPLNKELVDIPFPYCTSISVGGETRATFSEMHISMTDVPLKHLYNVESRLRSAVKRIIKQGIDMKRLHAIIDRDELLWRHGLEEIGGEAFSSDILDDFMYGDDAGSKLAKRLQMPEYYTQLRGWSSKQWIELIDRWILQQNALIVRSEPSATMSQRIEDEERHRVESRIAELGEDGLERQARIVEEAKRRNDEPMPDEIAGAFASPNVASISWIDVQSASTVADSDQIGSVEANSDSLREYLETDQCVLPYTLHFDHVSSQFITVSIYISMGQIPVKMKRLVYILQTLFFSATITLEDGTKLDEDQLLHQLDQDLVSYSFSPCDAYEELLCLSVTAETSKYPTAVAWIRRLLWSREENVKKLETRLAILKQSLPEALRDVHTAFSDVQAELLFTDKLTARPTHARRLVAWVPELEAQLKRNPKGIVKDIEALKDILLRPEGFTFSVLGDVLKLEKPRTTWMEHFQTLAYASPLPIPLVNETLSGLGKSPSKKAVVVSLSNIESSFSGHFARMFTGYSHPEYAAMIVAAEVLNGAELYFWKRIRGAGLAYGAAARHDLQAGLISFRAWSSPDAAKAFAEAKMVVEGLVDRTIPLEPQKLEAAKNAYAYTVADNFSTRMSMADSMFINRVFRNRTNDWLKRRLEDVQRITTEDVLGVMEKYILPVFRAESSISIIVCGPNQADGIAQGLERDGYEVEIRHWDDRVPWSTEAEQSTTEKLRAGVIMATSRLKSFLRG